uniref:RNA transcription, translation and transport factor protein n=1 Tax=Timema bartmani TaxID=61472 RepID=A0A7R9HWR9_9NEOP|nr:unnamed protein product [Timema bartmani]
MRANHCTKAAQEHGNDIFLSSLNSRAREGRIGILDENQFRNLVIWLEDQKIRHYKIEDRQPLRDIKSADWPKAFKRYRNDLACPVQGDKDSENLEWLLSFAVRLEYSDNGNADFKKGVNALAQLLNVTAHPDHLITLKAVSKVVQRRISAEALENPDSVIVKGQPFPFQEADLGFDTGDYVLNQAAKILSSVVHTRLERSTDQDK